MSEAAEIAGRMWRAACVAGLAMIVYYALVTCLTRQPCRRYCGASVAVNRGDACVCADGRGKVLP